MSIEDVLIRECQKINLKERYTLKMRSDVPIEIPRLSTSYDEQVYLKEHLQEKLHSSNDSEYLKTCYWITRGWGGLHRFF